MFLTELFEQQTTKHAAFCFGRMNPPTVGHAQLINTVAKAAQGGDYFVFVSQTQDSKKNPLDYATKVKFIKALFPDQAGHVVYASELKTIMQVAEWLYNAGYRSVTFAAGSDRLDSFKKLLTDYNGKEGGNVYYKFDAINFVSSGDRDPDADGIAGVSASSAREAASQGNLEAFAQATGAGKLAKPLYDAVRKGMLLETWSKKYKNSINCSNPKGFSQKAHCAGRKKTDEMADYERDMESDPSDPIPFPPGTTLVNVSDVYDWYKLGMAIPALDKADPRTFNKGVPHTVFAFGSEEEEAKMMPLLQKLGFSLHDIDNPEDYEKAMRADEAIAFLKSYVNENFADGKGPGRPGDSQRHGIPKGATMAQLEKAAKAPGRKGQLARWQINMRRGKKK
jgi:hypothetical protein